MIVWTGSSSEREEEEFTILSLSLFGSREVYKSLMQLEALERDDCAGNEVSLLSSEAMLSTSIWIGSMTEPVILSMQVFKSDIVFLPKLIYVRPQSLVIIIKLVP